MYILENELKLKEYEFAQRKNLPWELKLYLTENRIREWNDRYDPYVSFSGGLDSTVLLHFVRKVIENDLEISSVYGDIVEEKGVYRTTGEQRTGCMFCMFGCHLEQQPNRFQRMKKTHPKLYEYCFRTCDKGGLGLGKVLDEINVPYKEYVPNIKDYEQLTINCAI